LQLFSVIKIIQSMSERIKGVDPELGDDVSKMLYEAAKHSWDNRPGAVVELHPSFSGVRALRPDYKPIDCYESMDSDGTGTKVEISERLKDHSVIAFDLFAMACDDAAIRGAEPIAINTILDVNKLIKNDTLTTNAVKEIATGYIGAAREAGVVILGGEAAELGKRVNGYGKFNYNWGATVLWYVQKDRLLTGHEIQPGDTLVGLAEHGFRSNGITDVREIMANEFGKYWHESTIKELGNVSLGKLVQKPSIIYSRLITDLTGGFDINRNPKAVVHGAAHITGGGQPSKLARMLEPSGYGVNIDNPIEPPPIMAITQKIGGYPDEKAYKRWHMGPGMIIATPNPDKVLEFAKEYGLRAQRIGEITEEPGIRIKNKGAQQQKEYLIF
jgi:phosphoribosylformylglycinamidine cyclo-ligase